MPFMMLLLVLVGVALVIVGAIAGRAYERNVWQQRLLDRLGVLDSDSRQVAGGTSAVRHLEPPTSTHVDHTIAAMALEIERIGEGQRFLTKLLAERMPSAVSRARSPIPGSVRSPIPPTST
jgi:hypothetical protein